ncbi:MAG: TetR/AcrR family transcriptional regulator [SAR92 clade bacterium]|uniref:TetR/AcrR family transcriptional regulator n=1 Tax=SAR92 clade bacterium TaxID=2315479 RepID=A0A520MC49_9GAMM|nr:MAG: TetR/AcrR family transcriptional regulator [SAR92 clade bacterium]
MNNDLKRARTNDEKYFRRTQILDSAELLFEEVGYESFSMANLAKTAGVVKGTLYLYFRTREEVFLTLYNQSLARWSEVFLSRLKSAMSDHDYACALYETAMADGSFVPLLARLEHVIEHNVSIEKLVESKRSFIQRVGFITNATESAISLNQTQAAEVVRTMGVLLVGATRADQAPNLDGEEIPADVQSLMDLFSSKNMFVKNACRIIAAIRAE